MNRSLILGAVCIFSLAIAGVSMAAKNLVASGDLEATAGGLPGGWEPLVLGVPAKVEADTAEKHGGQSSVRIVAGDITRSYIRSTQAIEVAPGETIEASAWVKFRDVPPDKGTVIMIAEFDDASGGDVGVEKFNVADTKKPTDAWQLIKGSVKVPENATRLHLRLGFSYSKGTVWWDDVTVTAKQPLVCRIELPDRRLSPAMRKLPVAVLNRSNDQYRIIVQATIDKKSASAARKLSGEAIEQFEIPIGVRKPGPVAVQAALLEREGGQPMFVDERKLTVPPPLALGVPSPTHWVIEDGQPTIEGFIDVATADEVRKGATLSVRVVDGEGNTRGEWRPGGGGAISDGRREFSLKMTRADQGDYKLVATLTPAGRGKPITDEQPWHVITREQARVTINPNGYLEHGGKAIFPLGIFNGAKFKEQADAGFTVTHAYNAVRIEGPDLIAADQRAAGYINNTHAHGMKALFMVPMKSVIAHDWETVRRRVRMFRNHPGLLAWDEEEGFARGDFKSDTLKTLRQIIEEEDPHHPFMVGDARAAVAGLPSDRSDFFPVQEMDLGMWWWYPFPLKERAGDALLGEDEGPAGAAMELAPPTFLINAKTRKPLWVGVQCYKKPGAGNRYPTPEEYRAQAYLALIHGAKGLMWYGGSVTGGLFLSPDEGHWPELKKVVREVRDQEVVFMSATEPPPEIAPADAPVSVMIKRTTKRKVLFAVNRTPNAVEVTVAGKRLSLPPFGVHVSDL